MKPIVVLTVDDFPKVHDHSCRRTEMPIDLAELLAELRAIRLWDLEYMSQTTHNEIERVAWETRRMRLEEIRRILRPTT